MWWRSYHSLFLQLYKVGMYLNQGVNSKRWGAINGETRRDFLIAKKATKRKKNEKRELAISFLLTTQNN